MEIFDISPSIREDMLIYPGDGPVKFNQLKNAKQGGWNLSEFCMGSHSGSHLDVPQHINPDGSTGIEVDLEKCIGSCQVYDFPEIDYGTSIEATDVHRELIRKDLIVLFKTKNSKLKRDEFYDDFVTISESAAKILVDEGVKAVGIDYLSIGNHDTHEILLEAGIGIYENLDLKEVPAGIYTFIGLPLKMPLEGLPSRCLLIKDFHL